MDLLQSSVISYVLLLILHIKCTKQDKSCQNIPVEDVQRKYMCWSAGGGPFELDYSFFQIQELRSRIRNGTVNFLDRNDRNVYVYPLSDRLCPGKMNTESTLIQDRAQCPWYLEMTYSEVRWPHTIIQSKCKCKSCKGCEKEKEQMKCEEIRLLKKILLKSCESNTTKCEWNEAYQELSVGCTSVALHNLPNTKSN
ncbi:hypothetical protein ACJMK2_011812 [Sinanodonta woodiana]|uniref:Uncharacterized protein n=1 Tax=Sinanodonta woodiana TaxID=1069815 RepID=A0ABD3V678_SINWO